MTKTYIAVGSVGEALPGQEVKGLNADRIQALLASGAIEEEKAPEQHKADGTAERLAELEKALATTEAALKKATTEAKKAPPADK